MNRTRPSSLSPLVSICCITYNHERYIRDCIEGFLSQKTDFPFEIVVHDDASTDSTAEILREYADKYPDLFVTILQPENQYSKGKKPLIDFVFKRARGKYIAICEGDDYWTDPLKLQKQVDFLEANPDYAICFHNAIVEFDDPKIPKSLFSDFSWNGIDRDRDVYTISDLIATPLIPTTSIVYRKSGCMEMPSWFTKIPGADHALSIIVCGDRRVKYFDGNWAVYRKHAGGITMNHDGDYFHASRIYMYLRFLEYFRGKYIDDMKKALRHNLDKLTDPSLIRAEDRERLFDLMPEYFASKKSGVEITGNAPLKVTFIANGPGKLNGPNIWLQRILPELPSRGIVPEVLFHMDTNTECNVMNHIRNKGIRCVPLPRMQYTEQNVRLILRALKANPPDLFVPNLTVPAYYATRWLKDAGIPTVGILHSDDNYYHELIDHFVAGPKEYRLSGIVCVSGYIEELVRERGIPDVDILNRSYGIEMPDRTAKFHSGKLNLVYTGRLVQRQKRIFNVIDSLKNVVNTLPDTYATIYGEDREEGRAIEAIRNSRCGNRLKYGGILAIDEIFDALLKQHVFVLLSDYEGMSISLMEAMGCGLVPVCTKTRSGATEIIRHNENGLLVENRDEDFLNAVRRLKTEKGLWERLSLGARETIENGYTIGKCADGWADFIRSQVRKTPFKAGIRIPEIGEVDLPPIKVTYDGVAREDQRRCNKRNGEIGPGGDRAKPVLAIVCPQVGAPSETFIRKHIEFLNPGRTVLLTGNVLDSRWFNGPIKTIPIRMGAYSFDRKQEDEVEKFLEEHGVTHILCEFGCVGAAVIELNARKLRRPVTVHFHGQDASEYIRRPEIAAYYKRMGSVVDGVVAVSKPMAERLVRVGIPERKLKIIHYGVDCPDACTVPHEENPCRFLSVSRLVGKKGIPYILQAFRKTVQAVPDATLDIIGEGPLREEIEKFIGDHDLGKSVRLHGEQPHGYVLDMMDRSSVFVQHSVVDPDTGNAEGLPLSILEASAHGLPVISTFHEGIPEAVEHEHTGFLVEERDWEAMAGYMTKLAADGPLRKKLGTAGRKKISTGGFTVEAMNRELRDFMGLTPSRGTGRQARGGKGVRRVMFVNHSVYPLEISGTPISTRNHAVGMVRKGLDVAVLIPRRGIGEGYRKEHSADGFILYQVPAMEKITAGFAVPGQTGLPGYREAIERIIEDFRPQVVHINDYVFMPAEIMEIFSRKGCIVVREVCNCEELCHLDYPVLPSGRDSRLCAGPEDPRKCAGCLELLLTKDGDEPPPEGFSGMLEEKSQRRFEYVKKLYRDTVDHVLFTSEPFRKYFTRFVPVPGDRMRVIPRGLDFDYPRNARTRDKADGKVHFAFAGILTFSKGVDVVLRAFEKISGEDNFVLHIYGPVAGSEYAEWMKQLESAHPDRFVYHGKFEDKDLPGMGSAVDVCIVPSYFDTYNRVLREFLYLGVPVIATDFFGSTPIRDGQNGFRIPIGDADALAERMTELIRHPGRIADLARGAAETKVPTLEEEIDLLTDAYDDLVERKPETKKGEADDRAALPAVKEESCPLLQVSIILPVFNGLARTRRCLEALVECTPGELFEVIVVDNGSTDGTADFLARLGGDVTVITNETNVGFARACNQGIGKARGEYVLLLHNDTVVTDFWLERLLFHLERYPYPALVAPMSNGAFGPQRVQDIPYGENMGDLRMFAGDFASRNAGGMSAVMGLGGFCLLARKEAVDFVGGLDEGYVTNSFTVDDLCLKSFVAGYQHAIAKDTFVHHDGGSIPRDVDAPRQAVMERDFRRFSGDWKELLEIHGNGVRVSMNAERQTRRLIRLGEERFSGGDLKGAMKVFLRVLQLDEKNSEAWNNLGVIQWQMGDPESAMDAFRKSLEINPGDASALENLARAAAATSRFDRIRPALFQSLRKAQPTNPDLLKLIDGSRGTA